MSKKIEKDFFLRNEPFYRISVTSNYDDKKAVMAMCQKMFGETGCTIYEDDVVVHYRGRSEQQLLQASTTPPPEASDDKMPEGTNLKRIPALIYYKLLILNFIVVPLRDEQSSEVIESVSVLTSYLEYCNSNLLGLAQAILDLKLNQIMRLFEEVDEDFLKLESYYYCFKYLNQANVKMQKTLPNTTILTTPSLYDLCTKSVSPHLTKLLELQESALRELGKVCSISTIPNYSYFRSDLKYSVLKLQLFWQKYWSKGHPTTADEMRGM